MQLMSALVERAPAAAPRAAPLLLEQTAVDADDAKEHSRDADENRSVLVPDRGFVLREDLGHLPRERLRFGLRLLCASRFAPTAHLGEPAESQDTCSSSTVADVRGCV